MSNWALILSCGIITYLTRFTMIALVKKEMFSDRIREVLSFVPSAIFPAIIFPAIFINDLGSFQIENNPKIAKSTADCQPQGAPSFGMSHCPNMYRRRR